MLNCAAGAVLHDRAASPGAGRIRPITVFDPDRAVADRDGIRLRAADRGAGREHGAGGRRIGLGRWTERDEKRGSRRSKGPKCHRRISLSQMVISSPRALLNSVIAVHDRVLTIKSQAGARIAFLSFCSRTGAILVVLYSELT